MKKILFIFVLSLYSIQGFASSCPDGSEPIKSVSDDGSYYVFNCVNNNVLSGKPYTNVSENDGPWSGPMIEITENTLINGPTPGRYSPFLKDTGRQRGGPQHWTGDFNNDGYVDFIYGGAVDDAKYNLIYSNRKGINNASDIDDNDPLRQIYSCGKKACITPNMMPEMFLGHADGIWKRSSYLLIDKRKDAGIRHGKPAVADFNGDGIQDFWFYDDKADESGHASSNKVRWRGFRDSYYLSQSNGTWLESSDTHLNKVINDFGHGGQAGDINGDGWIDMLSTTGGKHVDCWINIGGGVMKYRKCIDGAGAYIVELADFDGDGDLDMYTQQQENASQPGHPKISCNDGNGWFRVCKDMSVFTDGDYDWVGSVGARSWDFDNDGDQDIILMRFRNLYVGVAMEIKENLGNMNFNSDLTILWDPMTKEEHAELKTEVNWANKYFTLKLHDVNDDGLMDVIFYDGKSGKYDNAIWLNKGNLKFELINKNQPDNPMVQIKTQQTNYKETAGEEIKQIIENYNGEVVRVGEVANEEQPKELSFLESQIKLLTDQRRLQVCSAVFSEFFGGEYYKRTNKDTYFFVSLDSNGKDCHYEWSTNEMTAFEQCEENTKASGKCTIYAIGDTAVWGNPKLYEDLRSQ